MESYIYEMLWNYCNWLVIFMNVGIWMNEYERVFYLSTQMQYSKTIKSRTVSTGQKGSKSIYNCPERYVNEEAHCFNLYDTAVIVITGCCWCWSADGVCRDRHASCARPFWTWYRACIIKTAPTTSSLSRRTQCRSLLRRSTPSRRTCRSVRVYWVNIATRPADLRVCASLSSQYCHQAGGLAGLCEFIESVLPPGRRTCRSVRVYWVNIAFGTLTLLVGHQEEHPACKDWMMMCWCGYLSGARCRLFAYGPADAIAIPKPIISCLI